MELNVRDAARVLRVSEKQIYRWIDDDEIPFYRVNDQPRFSRAELLEWATSRKMPVSVDVFAGEGESRPNGPGLVAALRAGGVHADVAGTDRESVLHAVVDLLALPPSVDREFLFQVLLAREAMGSTGIGGGIAIPHVRNPVVLNGAPASITVCYLAHPIPFDAIDGQPVHTVFSMISSTIKGHLQLLARLSWALHDPKFKELVSRRAGAEELVREAVRIEASFPYPGKR
ncbi:MAG: PTS sugar transporter subunit IIA [Thermodesulfobacteriota bacterium]